MCENEASATQHAAGSAIGMNTVVCPSVDLSVTLHIVAKVAKR